LKAQGYDLWCENNDLLGSVGNDFFINLLVNDTVGN